MMSETFLNETYGINGITKISLKKIIEVGMNYETLFKKR